MRGPCHREEQLMTLKRSSVCPSICLWTPFWKHGFQAVFFWVCEQNIVFFHHQQFFAFFWMFCTILSVTFQILFFSPPQIPVHHVMHLALLVPFSLPSCGCISAQWLQAFQCAHVDSLCQKLNDQTRNVPEMFFEARTGSGPNPKKHSSQSSGNHLRKEMLGVWSFLDKVHGTCMHQNKNFPC